MRYRNSVAHSPENEKFKESGIVKINNWLTKEWKNEPSECINMLHDYCIHHPPYGVSENLYLEQYLDVNEVFFHDHF